VSPLAATAARPKTALEVFDLDVHPPIDARVDAALAYMKPEWRRQVEYLGLTPMSSSPLNFTYLTGIWVVGRNAPPRSYAPPSEGVDALRRDLLDKQGVEVAQLVAGETVSHSMQGRNRDLAANLAAAFNDYVLDQWVTDPRLRYAASIIPGAEDVAVAEIRRLGRDSRVSSIWIPLTATSLGTRHFDPIYRAALEYGLPIVIHPGSGRWAHVTPELALEGRASGPTAGWSALAGLITGGALQRHPNLRLVFMEFGFTWLEPMLRRLDAGWRANRSQLRDLAKAPSEYVREQVRFTTSPADDDRPAAELCALIEDSDLLPEVLVFSSNHPRAGAAWPGDAFTSLKKDSRRKLFAGNAKEALRI
jgi:predicted TIM-barrel fold metal-dependent hydrolase